MVRVFCTLLHPHIECSNSLFWFGAEGTVECVPALAEPLDAESCL